MDLCKDVEAFPTIKRLEQQKLENEKRHGKNKDQVWSSVRDFKPLFTGLSSDLVKHWPCRDRKLPMEISLFQENSG